MKTSTSFWDNDKSEIRVEVNSKTLDDKDCPCIYTVGVYVESPDNYNEIDINYADIDTFCAILQKYKKEAETLQSKKYPF